MLRRREDGIRPIHLRRDLHAIVGLIEIAFGDDLDARDRQTLRSMRLPRFLLPWVSLVDSLTPPGEGMMPGFVWVKGGRVVGTASIRRLHSLGSGWLLSNVAVHPDYRGQGLGRALVEASLDYAAVHGARWVTLQVREGNQVARHLYVSLGFRDTANLVRFRRFAARETPKVPWARLDRLRPAGWGDNAALGALTRRVIPTDLVSCGLLQRESFRVGAWDWVLRHFKRLRKRWWVMGRRRLSAGVGIELGCSSECHCLRLLVEPDARSLSLASALIAYGLEQLRQGMAGEAVRLPVQVEHPADDAETLRALAGLGFEKVWTLVHMRLSLSRRST